MIHNLFRLSQAPAAPPKPAQPKTKPGTKPNPNRPKPTPETLPWEPNPGFKPFPYPEPQNKKRVFPLKGKNNEQLPPL